MLHGGRLCAVFSARNYCGYRTNDAALVVLLVIQMRALQMATKWAKREEENKRQAQFE